MRANWTFLVRTLATMKAIRRAHLVVTVLGISISALAEAQPLKGRLWTLSKELEYVDYVCEAQNKDEIRCSFIKVRLVPASAPRSSIAYEHIIEKLEKGFSDYRRNQDGLPFDCAAALSDKFFFTPTFSPEHGQLRLEDIDHRDLSSAQRTVMSTLFQALLDYCLNPSQKAASNVARILDERLKKTCLLYVTPYFASFSLENPYLYRKIAAKQDNCGVADQSYFSADAVRPTEQDEKWSFTSKVSYNRACGHYEDIEKQYVPREREPYPLLCDWLISLPLWLTPRRTLD